MPCSANGKHEPQTSLKLESQKSGALILIGPLKIVTRKILALPR